MKVCSKCGRELGGPTGERMWTKLNDGTLICEPCYNDSEEQRKKREEEQRVAAEGERKRIEMEKKTFEETLELFRKKSPLELIATLGDTNPDNRKNAAIILGELKYRRGLRALIEILKTDDNDVVLFAVVEAIGKIGDPRPLNELQLVHKRFKQKLPEYYNEATKREFELVKLYHLRYGGFTPLGRINREAYQKCRELEAFTEKTEKTINELKQIKFNKMAQVVEMGLKEMSWQDFEDAVTEALNAVPSDTRTSDMGIDGITSKGIPIQIKQSERIGRNVVDNFETALRRYYPSNKKNKKGIIVAFSFTKGSYTETDRAKREDNIDIQLIQAEELVS